jgi:hypothetical protein
MKNAAMNAFDDELEKIAFLDKLRERIFGPKVRENEPTPVLEDKSKVWSTVGRLGDFLRGYMGSETWHRRSHGMLIHPGKSTDDEVIDAVNAMSDQLGEFPFDLNINASGWGGYDPDIRSMDVTQGQLGSAYHEGGHMVGIERMSPAIRDAYLDVVHASHKHGARAGLALLPNALLDPPGKRRALSKWGPVAAAVPSLPILFEEARANIIGGKAAKSAGHMGAFLNDAIPSYAGYVAQAGAVPLGLYLIHRAKEKRLADAQKAARDVIEEEMASPDFPKEARVAVGFADELEKFGGLKQLLGGVGIGLLAPGLAKGQLMSGAQNFNDPRRAPRHGGGHIAAQQGPLPLIEKIRFNPIATRIGGGVRDVAKGIGGGVRDVAKGAGDAVGTAMDYYKGDFGRAKTSAVNSPYSGGRRIPHEMSMAQREALEMAERLHARVGGVDPSTAMMESRLAGMGREVDRIPNAEWMKRALKTGELARYKDPPWLGYREPPMERVLSLGEPMSAEQIALSGIAPKPSLAQRLRSILGDRGAARAAGRSALRR